MKYTRKQLGIKLKNELDKGYDPKRIANWAHDLFYFSHNQFSDEVEQILQNLLLMEAGPEFEESEENIKKLIENLTNEGNT
ncbi:hypothetical protein PNK_p0024 (plasmid) [Candidatus Protochlamydia naegleriophila]|uniref:Uncharacterized protein n=1 Tax=Candidatus Protochlamydia naegleriophila TaxID=389348 RepID=A0A0U5JEY8_9BACT|nr:hypothetical protein [Candidatus Protochlamydia naegleriophila]CUI18078.1 hypothetical protein PNK_p0024 [Candidatus Protochlamydia naegleriophila]